MKEIYTKKLLLFCCFLFLGVSFVNAQFTLDVTAPDSLKGSYSILLGSSGTAPLADISADIYYQDGLACDTVISPDGAGKIVLIDRGTCAFLIKYEAAQKGGAAAVIVCNNAAGANTVISGTSFTPRTIPIFMATQADCAKIKADITSSPLSGTVKNNGCPTAVEYDPAVFWGNTPGQGDFSNGLGDWTMLGVSAANDTFHYLPTGTPYWGGFNGSNAFFNSPTYCNGVMSMSFVYYNTVNNPALSQPYYVSTAELISPTIDCSGKEYVAIEFYTLIARLNRHVKFSYSTDDGETWSEPEDIVTANAVNGASKATEKFALPLPTFTNQPKCKVKFVAEGDFYYFMIDDVTLIDKKVFDMTISKDYYGGARQYATPFNQVGPVHFTLDIENTGNVPAEGVKVALDVYDYTTDTPELMYTDTIDYGTVAVGLRDADRIFPTSFTPAEKEAYYLGVYTLLSDSIAQDDDTEALIEFESTKNYFSNIPDDPAYVNGWTQSTNNFLSGGSFYKINKGTWPDGQVITLDKGRMGAYVNGTNVSTSAILSYDVYKWEDTNQDTFVVQGNERTLIATGTTFIESSVDTVSIELFDPLDPSKKVVLPNEEMNLLVVASISPIDDTGARWFLGSVNPFQGDNNGLYHGYAAALADLNSGGNIWTGSFFGEGTSDDILSRDLVQTTLTMYNPLYFTEVDIVNNKEINTALKINAYPVPAVTNINVDLSFDKTQDYANIFVTDMSGRIVHAERYVNIQARNLNIDVSKFAAGVYNLRVVTESGFNTQNISVVK